MVIPEQIDLIEPAYRDAFGREIERMAAAIPPEQLSIQWDCTYPLDFESAKDDAARRALLDYMIALARLVPDDVQVGYHLCYGEFEHKHAWDPTDLGTCVSIANVLVASAGRPIDWVHMPVPRNRDDVDYFEPLRELDAPAETSVVLGLVHHTDGIDGTRRRIEAASRVRAEFAIATECGMGRRQRDTIAPLLQIHANAADLGTVTA